MSEYMYEQAKLYMLEHHCTSANLPRRFKVVSAPRQLKSLDEYMSRQKAMTEAGQASTAADKLQVSNIVKNALVSAPSTKFFADLLSSLPLAKADLVVKYRDYARSVFNA